MTTCQRDDWLCNINMFTIVAFYVQGEKKRAMNNTDVEHHERKGYSAETIVPVPWLKTDLQVLDLGGRQRLRRGTR
jgi:hypothetical protein